MGYPRPNIVTATIMKRSMTQVVCSSFQPSVRDNTQCALCAYAVWEHAKFPHSMPNINQK